MRWFMRVVAAMAMVLGFVSLAEAGVVARINLNTQRMQVVVDGTVAHEWAVSSGRSGYTTPTGSWSAKSAHKHWHSRKYDAPMPHAVFFSGGYAIHATSAVRSLGSPASHGCIRLHPANARAFYELVREYGLGRTQVVIHRGAGDLPVVAERRQRTRVATADRAAERQLAAEAATVSRKKTPVSSFASLPAAKYQPVAIKASVNKPASGFLTVKADNRANLMLLRDTIGANR